MIHQIQNKKSTKLLDDKKIRIIMIKCRIVGVKDGCRVCGRTCHATSVLRVALGILHGSLC
jgi:hypothetical protein